MIYVTGATGYLGGHIMTLLGRDGYVVRPEYVPKGATVIHCAGGVPTNDQQVNDVTLVQANVQCMQTLLLRRPSYVVWPDSWRAERAYAASKAVAREILTTSGIPYHILSFPGLFGPPKNHGLVYAALRHLVHGTPFTAPPDVLKSWSGMYVVHAAQLCVEAAQRPTAGATASHHQESALEEILAWIRSS